MAKSFIRVFLNASGKRIGESHPGAKLTDHECDLVAQLVADGMTLSAVAEKFGISKAGAWKIATGRRRGKAVAQVRMVSVK